MSTVATPLVRQLASDWEKLFSSADMVGVVGNAAHARRGGYHIGRQFQPADNYSCIRPDDKLGPDDAAAAIDMRLSDIEMRACTSRLVTAFTNVSDPRRKYLNAFNGTQDNKTARRWDVYARKIQAASADHLWHVHLEIRRKYVNSPVAMKAILSILKGESVANYLHSIGLEPTITLNAAKAAAPKYPGRVMVRNDHQIVPDKNVKLFQQQMRKRGWTSVTADGFFGAKTYSAVKRFQVVCGVKSDGVIGPTTWPLPWTHPIGK